MYMYLFLHSEDDKNGIGWKLRYEPELHITAANDGFKDTMSLSDQGVNFTPWSDLDTVFFYLVPASYDKKMNEQLKFN